MMVLGILTHEKKQSHTCTKGVLDSDASYFSIRNKVQLRALVRDRERENDIMETSVWFLLGI